jgi:hypothetical protein
MLLANDNTRKMISLGTSEAEGIKMGASCAKAILARPDVSGLAMMGIITLFLQTAEKAQAEFRRTGELTPAGVVAFRKGFDRGLQSQLKNPAAKIEVRKI